jgi:hypothetical protein
MKRLAISLIILIVGVGVLGCSSNSPPPSSDVSEVTISKKFRFDKVSFKFSQTAEPKIAYHTSSELEALINNKIISDLKEKNLLSEQDAMNELKITASYVRRFVGDATSFSSDSLAYPDFSYEIEVIDNGKVIKKVGAKGLVYKGGFAMNLQVMAASLRDKKYEVKFTDALANTIVKRVSQLSR